MSCYRCGIEPDGRVAHPISSPQDIIKRLSGERGERGICLFCSKCDEIVTPEERWKALDKWKIMAVGSILKYYNDTSASEKLAYIKDILATEMDEFPRT